jgi:PAS domain S-box-containing protein
MSINFKEPQVIDFQKVFEKLNSIILVLNKSGNIEYVNNKIETVLGYKPEEIIGKDWWFTTNYSNEDKDISKKYLDKLLNDKVESEDFVFERRIKSTKGTHKYILWSASVMEDDKVLVIGNDITIRKQSELELSKVNNKLRERHLDLTKSVEYAKRIQDAILPKINRINKFVPQLFVYYNPKDVVSGDFYYFHKYSEDVCYLAAIDCTGHGVPGSMLTVLANSLLREIIVKRNIEDPANILYELDKEVNIAFMDEDGHNLAKDGMDLSIVRLDKSKNEIKYAGANRPLFCFDKISKELTEVSASRFPIGYIDDRVKVFTTHTISTNNQRFYMLSDGFVDQFGGDCPPNKPLGKKFSKKRFKNLIGLMADMEMTEQEKYLDYVFDNWKQKLDQIDDVIVMGFEI